MMGGYQLLAAVLTIANLSIAVYAAQVCGELQEDNPSKVLSVPISAYFNNQAFGSSPGEADFDGTGQSYVAQSLKLSDSYQSPKSGIDYQLASYLGEGKPDNVICRGQTIPVSKGRYFSANLLVASDKLDTLLPSNITFTYSSNKTVTTELRAKPWWSILTLYKGDIILPSRFTTNGTDFNTTHIFEWTVPLLPSEDLVSVTFPNFTTGTRRIHVFSMSLLQVTGVQVQYVRPTQKSKDGRQLVEIGIDNAGPDWVSGPGLNVSLSGSGITTVEPGFVKRLRPGDQKRVVLVVSGQGISDVEVSLDGGNISCTASFTGIDFGLKEWTSDLKSLNEHESPEWFNGAKYGIFIHWGPYAVPGWGNSTPYEVYAEWYWWYSHHKIADKADTYDNHLRTYGPDVIYNDFFPNFTASNYDPKSWVDLFDEAGAEYFVITSKHHDGFAIFDTEETTHRSALHYGPKRDLLGELLNAAAEYQPHLHRGTYYSLPEWYNPDFGPYGFTKSNTNTSVSWLGIPATNPYTGEIEPYLGRLNISDYISDLLVPQMEILAYKYNTDIMWCDCGAANGTAEFASKWFNQARSQGREVTINSRCGIPEASDFDTPEYKTFSSISQRKWESNRGMDPYSYGYNRATPDDAYMNATTIIRSLVDIISKNGNFLLDIGPKADGSIHDVEARNLREAGRWIKDNKEAIFNTTYWFVRPEVGEVRFTQTDEAFYILMLSKPAGTVHIDAPIPVLEGDKIVMIGAGNGTEVAWTPGGEGIDVIIPPSLADAGDHCWVLKIEYIV